MHTLVIEPRRPCSSPLNFAIPIVPLSSNCLCRILCFLLVLLVLLLLNNAAPEMTITWLSIKLLIHQN